MSEFWKLVLTALGAIGTTTGLLLFLLKQYGKSWIENRFAQRLAHFTHQQDVELHKLRIEIDSILSGALKIQEKEFETLPKAWRKLDEAFVQLNNLVSPIIRKVDLDNKSELQLEEFLEDSELLESEQLQVQESSIKWETYEELIFPHNLFKVKMAISDLDKYVVRYSIFFPPPIKEKFEQILKSLGDATRNKELGRQFDDHKTENESWAALKSDIEPLFKSIGADIHAQLRSHSKSKPQDQPSDNG